MKKLLIAFIVLLFWGTASAGMLIGSGVESVGTVYIDDIPFTDNAASTVMTNNGTGSDWVCYDNTSTVHTTVDLDGTGHSFLFNAGGEGAASTDNVTSEKFEVKFYYQATTSGPSVANENIYAINASAASTPDNCLMFWRPSGLSEVRLTLQSSTSSTTTWNSTNWPSDTGTYLITITVDAVGQFNSIVVKYGATTITWSSSTYPTGEFIFNSPHWLSSSGSYESQAYFTGFTFEDLE